jgi:hypothetical protein
MRHLIADFDAGPKSASGKLEIKLALGTECGRVTVDS